MKTPFKMFGEIRFVEVVTYTDGKKDLEPKAYNHQMWIERGEDWYGLMSYPKGATVRVVTREQWLKAKRVGQE